jgi:hypothetical protein
MEASRLCIEDRPGEVNNAVSACDDAVRGDVGRDPDNVQVIAERWRSFFDANQRAWQRNLNGDLITLSKTKFGSDGPFQSPR